jgi:hypothetical protein
LHREGAEEELRTLTATEYEKRRMQDILRLLHQQQIEDLEGGGSGGSSENDKNSENSDDNEELMPGFSLHRALLFAQGELNLDDLTAEELEAFQREALDIDGEVAVAEAITAWQPWWMTQDAAELQLSVTGTKCIEEIETIENPASSNANIINNSDQVVPPPPATPLPPLSSLISQPPSPTLPLHLLDLLYSYCLTLRLFNGQYTTDVLDAVSTVLTSSSVLGGRSLSSNSHLHSPPSSTDVPSTVLLSRVMHVCSSTDAGRAQVPRSFAIGILSDVAMVLQLGRAVIVTALIDLSRLVDAGLIEARSCVTSISSSSKNKNDQMNVEQQLEYKNTITQLKQAQRKLLFFLSWANEVGDSVAPALAMATGIVYEQQRATVVGQNSEKQVVILPTMKANNDGSGDGDGGVGHNITLL